MFAIKIGKYKTRMLVFYRDKHTSLLCQISTYKGAQYIKGESLKAVWAQFSTLG
jgi:hypothetical protein